MKVVLFCGGMGMRLREHAESLPKPLVAIGSRPILWHVMKYYAHYGHKDFILCLGYKSALIKDYFLRYNEATSNDFVLSDGGRNVQLLGTDIQDWRITCVETGLTANIGQRLAAVRKYLDGEDVFLANYADGLTDYPLPEMIDHFLASGKIGAFLCVRPTQSFHVVWLDDDDTVTGIQHLARSGLFVNGGYFIFRRQIFDYLRDGEELVEEPFGRLIAERQLAAYRHDGFWMPMDTFKDKQLLEDMYARGAAPWEVWKKPAAPSSLAREKALAFADDAFHRHQPIP
ncbi:MAG: glucose-1-phosphate cytidylyltransferase [Gemmatimonadetes bacterium]|nr:glucose-1-phosphate cytidylyltransferase [Gemmatimonadota bacterium]